MSVYDGVDKLLLTTGAVGVMPTDTVYGLVCRAEDQVAVARFYNIKKRHRKPGTIIAANVDQLVELGIKRSYLNAVQQFWPGPISVAISQTDGYINKEFSEGVIPAVRIPSINILNQLLLKTGPLLTTSANLPNQPSASNLMQAREYFGKDVDFYVDGGDLSDRLPSTVVRIIDDEIEVVREGAVKL